MFNGALFLKTLKDSAITVGLAAVGIVSFVVLIVFAMLNMGTEVLEFVSKIEFIKKIFEVTLGISVEGEISINMLFAVSYTHGMILMLTWGTLIATTTRVLVGEIERGTADILLSLPMTRWEVYFTTSSAWLAVACILSLCPLVGVMIGSQIFVTDETVQIDRYYAPTLNFFAVNVAVASLACFVSCLLDRRAHAVGTIVAVAFVSVVLNFLEPFITWIKSIRFLGLLHYYRPVDVVRTGDWPLQSIGTLLLVAGVCWILGFLVFQNKDIPTA